MGAGSSIRTRRDSGSLFESSFSIRRQSKGKQYEADEGSRKYDNKPGYSFFTRGGSRAPAAADQGGCKDETSVGGERDGEAAAAAGEDCTSEDKEETQSTFFVLRGERYDTYDSLKAALASSRPVSRREMSVITKDRLRACVHSLFSVYVPTEAEISEKDFGGLATSVAAELGMDVDMFRGLGWAFDRFDINGDGNLDEEECTLLAECMLRYYLDSKYPRQPGQASSFDLDRKEVEEFFELKRKVGQGGQGVVYLATEKKTEAERIVKIFDKSNRNAPIEEVKQEFRLLKALDHPRIQRLYDIFEDRSHVYVISEPYFGGHLGDLIESAIDASVHVTTGYIAKVLHQVVHGVSYLHSKYITHCDLKEPNIMIAAEEDMRNPSVVVIDFGLAHCFAQRGCSGGTPGYMPPEVWSRGLWTPKGDVFSLGVVFYQIYSGGERAFRGWSEDEMERKTMEDMPDFETITVGWRRVEDLISMLEVMLNKDPRQRPTAKGVLEDKFFTTRCRPKLEECTEYDEFIPPEVMNSMLNVSKSSRLQKAAQEDFASRQNLASLQKLNAAFDAMDTDHDGVLTADEVRTAMKFEGLEDDEVEAVVQNLVGADGQVAYTLFMGSVLAGKALDETRVISLEFEALDIDETGYLDRSEASLLMKKPALADIVGGRDAEELMALMDLDCDGRVSYDEFRRALAGGDLSQTRRLSEIAAASD